MIIEVKEKFDLYPNQVRNRLLEIRELIFAVAQTESLGEVMESLKWGEPSYTVKKGSAVRLDWKSQRSESVSVYFNCKTTLVETFREIYPGFFQFVGNRELVLLLSDRMPLHELKVCISLSLRYHTIKHLPFLGM